MVYAINFPFMYTNLLHFLSLLEFNFVDVLPFGCLAGYNYFTSMLMMSEARRLFDVVAAGKGVNNNNGNDSLNA